MTYIHTSSYSVEIRDLHKALKRTIDIYRSAVNYLMDAAVSIERRLSAMKQIYDAGIRTVCFISPVFPGITDIRAIFERAKDQCDLVWLENLNLRGGFKKTIMDYIADKHSDLMLLYEEIYNRKNRSYFEALVKAAEEMARENNCRFVDNETPCQLPAT